MTDTPIPHLRQSLRRVLDLFSPADAIETAFLLILAGARVLAARVGPAHAHAHTLQDVFEADFLVDFGHAAGVLRVASISEWRSIVCEGSSGPTGVV